MRLIDADEVRKHAVETYQGNGVELETIMMVPLSAIDNAPTVEVPENAVNCVLTMFGNCSYNKTGCSDCEIKDKIRKALNERPQGDILPVGTTININPEDIKWNMGDQISRETIEKIIVGMLEKWSDGYCYIEIPTDDAIREMKSAINNVQLVDISKPNCVTCDHFGKCEGCKKREEE